MTGLIIVKLFVDYSQMIEMNTHAIIILVLIISRIGQDNCLLKNVKRIRLTSAHTIYNINIHIRDTHNMHMLGVTDCQPLKLGINYANNCSNVGLMCIIEF